MMELGYGNAKEGRSMSFAVDLCIKTYQNEPNFHIDPKHEFGLVFWEIFEFMVKSRERG